TDQWNGSVSLTTPTFRHLTASASFAIARTPIFREAAPGRSQQITATIDLRPTNALRSTFQLSRLTIDRRRCGSRFSTETIPRLKVEYQLSPAIFFRFVGQYSARHRSPLVDRNGVPIWVPIVPDTTGVPDRGPDQGEDTNEFRMDWLFSYR